jgi:hypothetical protein
MTTPVYNDAKAAAAKAFVSSIRTKIDVAYDAILAEADLTREEKANLMLEIHNQYVRNDTLGSELGRAYRPLVEKPEGP